MLPEGFLAMLRSLRLDDVAAAMTDPPQVSVRLNRAKPRAALADTPGAEPVGWCQHGLYLPERPSFTLDPQWHQGLYYVQEAGSMFHGYIADRLFGNETRALRVLDACAAPGGKTTAVIDALPPASVMVANEWAPARAAVLKENLIKWGYPSTIVTCGDTARLSKLRETFDLIIADVPCSGEGMMRKDTTAVSQWSESLVADCARLQREIAGNLWPALIPGGILIYSTCTFNRLEDEENVKWICEELGGETVEIDVDPSWGITGALTAEGEPDTTMHCYRFLPGRTRSEGLFVAVIRKTSAGDSTPSPEVGITARPDKAKGRTGKSRDSRPAKGGAAAVSPAQCPRLGPEFDTLSEEGRLSAFPHSHRQLLERVKASCKVIYEGVQLANVKGSTLIPAHPLALTTARSEAAGGYPRHDIDLDTALDYLRGLSPVLPGDVPAGYVLLTYRGYPLGFVKNLGKRSNSLYPWKIHI